MDIKILGKAAVITAQIKKDVIVKLAKFAPEALILKDDKDVAVFGIGFGKAASITQYGIEFNDVDKDGNIQMTHVLPDGVEDKKQYMLDTYGAALYNLTLAEAAVTTAYATLKASFDTVAENITEA